MRSNYNLDIIHSFIHDYYLSNFVQEFRAIDLELIEELSNLIVEVAREGRRFFAFGNGGSEAIANILIHLLETSFRFDFKFDAFGSPLSHEIIEKENEKLFLDRIKRSGCRGDLVFLISASGDSLNINEVSGLCRRLGITTISLSGRGTIVNGPNAAKHNIVFDLKDQQILEDVTLAVVDLLIIFAKNKLEGRENDYIGIRSTYENRYLKGFGLFDVNKIQNLIDDLIFAYRNNYLIRIDSPDSGVLSLCAKHLEHNLKWDSLSDLQKRSSNRVFSGLSSCHLTGVGNDGGENYNFALEIEDNLSDNDVEIVFARSVDSLSAKSLIKAANSCGCKLHVFCFNSVDECIDANLTQSILHITARILNSYLLLYQGTIDSTGFASQLEVDLALLRQKESIKEKLESKFAY